MNKSKRVSKPSFLETYYSSPISVTNYKTRLNTARQSSRNKNNNTNAGL